MSWTWWWVSLSLLVQSLLEMFPGLCVSISSTQWHQSINYQYLGQAKQSKSVPWWCVFSVPNLALAGFPLTSVVDMHVLLNMLNLCLCSSTTVHYFLSIFGHKHLYDIHYEYFKQHCYKCNIFACIRAMKWGCACCRAHKNRVYLGIKPK